MVQRIKNVKYDTEEIQKTIKLNQKIYKRAEIEQ